VDDDDDDDDCVCCVKANANQLLTSSVPALNDSLLQHNRDLTAYVGQLSTERQALLFGNAELQQKLAALEHAAPTRTQQVCSFVLSGCWQSFDVPSASAEA